MNLRPVAAGTRGPESAEATVNQTEQRRSG